MKIRGTEMDNLHFSGEYKSLKGVTSSYEYGHHILLGVSVKDGVSNSVIITADNFDEGLNSINLDRTNFRLDRAGDIPLLVATKSRARSSLRLLFTGDMYSNLSARPQITRIRVKNPKDVYDIHLLAVGINVTSRRREVNALVCLPSEGYYELCGEWYSLVDDALFQGEPDFFEINLLETVGLMSKSKILN